jgi:hypothetical protein
MSRSRFRHALIALVLAGGAVTGTAQPAVAAEPVTETVTSALTLRMVSTRSEPPIFCGIGTWVRLDPINGSNDVYVSYDSDTSCHQIGIPYPMSALELVVAAQWCNLPNRAEPTGIDTCQNFHTNFGRTVAWPSVHLSAPNGAVRCYECKGDLIEVESLHRLWAPPGHYFVPDDVGVCTYNPTLTFAQCETRDSDYTMPPA